MYVENPKRHLPLSADAAGQTINIKLCHHGVQHSCEVLPAGILQFALGACIDLSHGHLCVDVLS